VNLEKIKHVVLSNIQTLVGITLLCFVVFFFAFFFAPNISDIAWLLVASLSASVLTLASGVPSPRENYIVNGEGMMALLAILIGYIFFPKIVFIISFFCFAAIALYQAVRFLIEIDFFAVFAISIVILIAGWYIVHSYDLSFSDIHSIFTGIARSSVAFPEAAIIPFLLVVPLHVVIAKLRCEIQLFSLGKNYFESSGYSFTAALIGYAALRCVLVAIVVLASGAFPAAGMAVVPIKRTGHTADNINAFIPIAIAVYALALIQAIFGSAIATIAALCVALVWPRIARRLMND
jgi:hypothetical protein